MGTWIAITILVTYAVGIRLWFRKKPFSENSRKTIGWLYCAQAFLVACQTVLVEYHFSFWGFYSDVVIYVGWLIVGIVAFAVFKHEAPSWKKIFLGVHAFVLAPAVGLLLFVTLGEPDQCVPINSQFHLRISRIGFLSGWNNLQLYERRWAILESYTNLTSEVDSVRVLSCDGKHLHLQIFHQGYRDQTTQPVDSVFDLNAVRHADIR